MITNATDCYSLRANNNNNNCDKFKATHLIDPSIHFSRLESHCFSSIYVELLSEVQTEMRMRDTRDSQVDVSLWIPTCYVKKGKKISKKLLRNEARPSDEINDRRLQ